MNQKINIHETAFVTASFRAEDSDLSKDSFAHLWANPSIEGHAYNYANAVSTYEGYAHCLRNRYFFDTIQELIRHHGVDTVLNFGCGFSMYPFALDAKVQYVEIDTSDVIDYKKDKVTAWQTQGSLPERDIKYIAADFNATSFEPLFLNLKPLVQGHKTFILLEGVLFFLGKQDTERLFTLFNRLQQVGDFMASVSFRPELEKQKVFKKLIKFVEGNLEKNQQFDYQTVADEVYHGIKNYKLIDHQDTFSLSSRYRPEKQLPKSEVLNEHMYLLNKSDKKL